MAHSPHRPAGYSPPELADRGGHGHMTPTPIPIALRAYTERRALAAEAEATTTPPSSSGTTRTRRPDPRWPKHVLVFDTETTTDETQRLIFGSYRVLKWNRSGGLDL